MKRNFDLIRKIMLEMEELPPDRYLNSKDVKGYDNEEVYYQMALMEDARLLVLNNVSSLQDRQSFGMRLTWEGHEFLDAARNDTIWEKATSTALEKAGSLTFDIVKSLLAHYIKEQVFPV